MKAAKEGSMKAIKPQRANLKDVKKDQIRDNKSLNKAGKKKNAVHRKNKTKLCKNKEMKCISCLRIKSGNNLKRQHIRKSSNNLHDFRKYFDAIFLSAFTSLMPSCISSMA